jgi:hypothetical protein
LQLDIENSKLDLNENNWSKVDYIGPSEMNKFKLLPCEQFKMRELPFTTLETSMPVFKLPMPNEYQFMDEKYDGLVERIKKLLSNNPTMTLEINEFIFDSFHRNSSINVLREYAGLKADMNGIDVLDLQLLND